MKYIWNLIEYFLLKFQEYKYLQLRTKYKIPESFRFNGNEIMMYGKGKIICGENSYIGSNSKIGTGPDTKVTIGNGCAISHNVMIYTSSYVVDQDFSKSKQNKYGDVIIGDNVWICANVYIGPGVIIGDNSVIGANTVVTKDIPAFAVVSGIPAKIIRYKSIINVS